jgi:hypothetical protein
MSATYEKGCGHYDVRSNYEGLNFCVLKLEKLSYQNSLQIFFSSMYMMMRYMFA